MVRFNTWNLNEFLGDVTNTFEHVDVDDLGLRGARIEIVLPSDDDSSPVVSVVRTDGSVITFDATHYDRRAWSNKWNDE